MKLALKKTFLFSLISVVFCGVSFADTVIDTPREVIVKGFGDASKWENLSSFGKVLENGNVLEIDSTKSEKKGFNRIINTKKRLLKPDTQYTLKFSVLMTEKTSEKFLHTFARNAVTQNAKRDVVMKNANYTSGKFEDVKVSFKTNQNAKDYSYYITIFGGTKCVIKNFSIIEGTFDKTVFIGEKSEEYKLDRASLPTGAKEFSVDLPKNKYDIVVKASDFGVKEGAENIVEKINTALKYCKKIGAAKLVFEKGKYKTTEEYSISLDGMKDFEFDGNGSTFIFRKDKGSSNMRIQNCERVKVHNFNFDWDWKKDPLASIVEVIDLKKNGKDSYIDLKFIEYKKFPRKDTRIVNLSSYDPKTKSVGLEGGFTVYYEFLDGKLSKQPEWLSKNILRVFSDDKKIRKIEKGHLFRLQHFYYGLGGINLTSNEHLTLKDINIFSCKGHAFVMGGTQKFTHFDNVNIVRPFVKRRPITCTADHFHISRSRGFLKMENCEFSLGADDCINMHDTSNFCEKISPTTVRTRNSKGFPVGTKVEFRQGDYSPANYEGTVVKSERIKGERNSYEIEFTPVLPEQLFDGFIMFNKTFDTRNVIVRNCKFHSNRARGILILARDVTIENCKFFHNEMGAIKIETGYTFNVWSEGYGVNNVVIRNNIFDTTNPVDEKVYGKARDVVINVYMKTDPSTTQTRYPILKDILFENNTFKDTFGLVAFIASSGNVTFANNTFINTTTREKPLEYRGNFYITHSLNTRIVNNTWIKSPYIPTPAVVFDGETSTDVLVQGNKQVDSLKEE